MDPTRFDLLATSLTTVGSRRRVLTAVVSGALAPLVARTPTAAHSPRRRCHKTSGKHQNRCRKNAKKHNPLHPPPCDVCSSGCPFTTVQAAINATSPQLSTIRVCPGTYVGNLSIERPLTVIGAGDGADPATNTILQGTGVYPVVSLYLVAVTLQRLRITGSHDGGIFNAGMLTLTDSTVVGNTTSIKGGGIFNTVVATLTLTGSTITANSSEERGGGIYNHGATTTLDAASRVIGNTAAADPRDPDHSGGGGIYNEAGAVTLSSAANVSGNTPDQCGGTSVPLCSG
jgi:hypothetical protein